MELLLLKYGYLLLFAGVFLEGEAFMLAGIFLATHGYFNLNKVVLVSLAANTFAAQFYYFATRLRGRPWFESRFADNPNYKKILKWMDGYGNGVLLLSRFLVGFRIIIPATCGALGMSQARFFVLNLIAAILWVIPMTVLGYYFGNSVAIVVERAHRVMIGGFFLAVLGLAVWLSIRYSRRVLDLFRDLEWADMHGIVPFVIGFIGVLNLLSALALGRRAETAFPPVERWLPLAVTQQNRVLMLFAGIALLQLTRSLARRKENAWWAAVIVLSASLLLHITSTIDLQHSLVSGLLLAYLIYFRRRFNARSDPASLRRALVIAPGLAAVVFFYGAIGLYATRGQFHWRPDTSALEEAFRTGILIVAPRVIPISRGASRLLASIQVAGWVARGYVLILILRPFVLRHRMIAPAGVVAKISATYGMDPASAFAVQEDKNQLIVAGGRGLITYATKGGVAIACGDPMAAAADLEPAVKEYVDHCVRHGWTPSVYLANPDLLPLYHSLDMASQPAAEEAILDLSRWQPANDHGHELPEMFVRRYDRAHTVEPYLDEQLEEVTEDWLQTRRIHEMGFTIGHFSLESLAAGPVFALGVGSRVEGFCAWLPYRNGTAMVMDLMRLRHGAPAYTAEMLVNGALQMLRDSGIREVCLSTNPLREPDRSFTPVDRHLVDEFRPQWLERYIVYPRGAALGRIQQALEAVQFGRSRARGKLNET